MADRARAGVGTDGLTAVLPNHAHHAPEHWWVPEAIGGILIGLALLVYLIGVRRHRQRCRGRWPLPRTAAWVAGLACLSAAWLGPLASAARADFTAHMAVHLLLGMIGPLLLVTAAPVTLALRALPVWVWAATGIRGAHATAWHTVIRLGFDQTVENATGVGAPPATWPADEKAVDVLHKAVFSAVTGLIAERVLPPSLSSTRGRTSH